MRQKPVSGALGAASAPTSLVAYFRVSTQQQGRSGLGLEAQQATVREHAERLGRPVVTEFVEIESGKRNDRPQLDAAIATCRRHKATLIVAKLDRLARNAPFLMALHDGLSRDAAGVYFCDLPQIPEGPIGFIILSVMAAMAQWEARQISIRTSAALQAAKARGKILGNPNLRSDGAGAARRRAARAHARDVLPYIAAAQKAGATRLRELAEALEARGVFTRSGSTRWSPEQVRRVLSYQGKV